MKIIATSIAALLLAGAAIPAAAEPAAGAAASQDGASASDQGAAAKAERKTCRRFDNSARRTQAVTLCLTKQEWKKFEESQED